MKTKGLKITRRTFLKATAATGVAAAVFSPDLSLFTGLVETGAPAVEEGEVKVLRSTCQMCHGGCGVLVHVRGGRVVKVEGNPEHALNQGRLCSKALASIQQLYNPTRLQHPLKRVGARCEGKWQRISWDEALDTISEKCLDCVDKYGPYPIVTSRGTGRPPAHLWKMPLVALGCARNEVSPSNVCHQSRYIPNNMMGLPGANEWPDWPNSKLTVMAGGASSTRGHSQFDRPMCMLSAHERDSKIIIIDPRCDEIASKADVWLPVRPGSDGALLLAWMHVILFEDLYDKEFITKWTNAPYLVRSDNGKLVMESDVKPDGDPEKYMVWDTVTESAQVADTPGVEVALFGTYTPGEVECRPAWDLLAERLKEWTPERVAEITWLPQGKIIETARMYGTIKPASFYWGLALDQHMNMPYTTMCQNTLRSMVGSIYSVGGDWPLEPGVRGHRSQQRMGAYRETPDQKPNSIGTKEYPLLLKAGQRYVIATAVWRAINEGIPYKPRVFLNTTSTLMWAGNQKMVWETLRKLEFIVDFDRFASPFSELADILLPGTTWLENDCTYYKRRCLSAQQHAVKPMYESWTAPKFCIEFAKRLGVGEYFPNTEEEWLDGMVKGMGLTWNEFKDMPPRMGPPNQFKRYEEIDEETGKPVGFPTPTGKLEIYVTQFLEHGYDPLPSYVEPPESPYSTPELAKEYPLILTCGSKTHFYFHSQDRQVPWLRELLMHPRVEMNPKTAAKLGIEEGDWVWIETPRGRVRQTAHLTNGIDPRVVDAQHNWWYPEKSAETQHGLFDSNINVLTSNTEVEPMVGAEVYRGLLCKIYKAEEGAPEGIFTKPEDLKPWLPTTTGGE